MLLNTTRNNITREIQIGALRLVHIAYSNCIHPLGRWMTWWSPWHYNNWHFEFCWRKESLSTSKAVRTWQTRLADDAFRERWNDLGQTWTKKDLGGLILIGHFTTESQKWQKVRAKCQSVYSLLTLHPAIFQLAALPASSSTTFLLDCQLTLVVQSKHQAPHHSIDST